MKKNTETQVHSADTPDNDNLRIVKTLLGQATEEIDGDVYRHSNYSYRFCVLQGALEKVRLAAAFLEEEAQFYV